jgi:hypothetical protein
MIAPGGLSQARQRRTVRHGVITSARYHAKARMNSYRGGPSRAAAVGAAADERSRLSSR